MGRLLPDKDLMLLRLSLSLEEDENRSPSPLPLATRTGVGGFSFVVRDDGTRLQNNRPQCNVKKIHDVLLISAMVMIGSLLYFLACETRTVLFSILSVAPAGDMDGRARKFTTLSSTLISERFRIDTPESEVVS